MTTDLVRIGHLSRPHGVRGEIALDGSSLSAAELQHIRSFTWRKTGTTPRTLTLEAARPVHGRVLVCFAGISSREKAAELTLGELLVDRSQLPEPGPGEAYTFQLVGLRVVTTEGRELGVVAEVMQTGAHPIWVVRGERELLVPAAEPFVQSVDWEAGVITVSLPPGLEQL